MRNLNNSRKSDTLGPCSVDEHRNFGYDSKDLTIGVKREQEISGGPGVG